MATQEWCDSMRADREEFGRYMEKWLRDFQAEMRPTFESIIRSIARDPEECERRLQELRQRDAARLASLSQP